MSRISSLAANTLLINQLLKTQARLVDLETQVTSEKKSQTYQGLSVDSQRLVNIENTRDSLQQFIQNNNQIDTRINIASSAVEAIQETISTFRANLNTYGSGATRDATKVEDIQTEAFRSLKSIEDLLNIEVDGRFVFSGARVDTAPADLGVTTLTAFQSTFDGARVQVSTTRDAHLEDFSFNQDSGTTAANWLNFERDQGATGVSRVTATSSEFTNVAVGTTITISGTGGVNDGTFEVAAVTGTTIDIRTEQFTDESAGVATVPITISYQDPANINNTLTINTSAGFTRATNTLTATAASLTNIPVGAKITIAGAAAGPPTNNGSFTVATNNGTALTVETKRFTDQGSAGNEYFQFTAAANLSFVDGGANADTIVAPANTFQDASGAALPVGLKLTIAGTTTANDGNTYTIASVSSDKSTVTLVSTDAVTAGAGLNGTVTSTTAAGTVAATSYYSGDQISTTHRVSKDRDFEFDITAVNPGFEKAIRAMKLIMQGVFQTEGGLDQNDARIGQALFLLDSSLDRTTSGTPPFGTEQSGSLDQIALDLSFNQVLLLRTNTLNEEFIGFLDSSIANIENVDPLEAITRLLDDQRSLEASFQTFSRVRQLSLLNFI